MTTYTKPQKNGLSSSLEDYLERIYLLQMSHSRASCSEISEMMGVNKTSVTSALRNLAENGMVNYQPYGKVTLTRKGMKIAKDVIARHETLQKFLGSVLLLPEEDADRIACGMEHHLTREAAVRLEQFMHYVECHATVDWKGNFGRYLTRNRDNGGVSNSDVSTAVAK